MASVVAVACGGQALDPGEADADTARVRDGDVTTGPDDHVSHCDELVASLKHYMACTAQPAKPDAIEAIGARCERDTTRTPTRCVSEFRDLTRCQARGLAACDRQGDSCGAEEQAYMDCVSGGACHDIGGGRIEALPENMDALTNHLACQCTEDEEGEAPAGSPCETALDCQTVCCSCPDERVEYDAAVCDKSRAAAGGPGVCASAEAACAATSLTCKRQ